MNPLEPASAQEIVADYARALERQGETQEWPAALDRLPYPKQTIKTALRTAVEMLSATGQLTDDLLEFLREAYVALADYVDADIARLMREYQHAGAALAVEGRRSGEKVQMTAWRTVSDTGALAGEIARTLAREADELRREFSRLTAGPPVA